MKTPFGMALKMHKVMLIHRNKNRSMSKGSQAKRIHGYDQIVCTRVHFVGLVDCSVVTK
jgi:hypothetical protein